MEIAPLQFRTEKLENLKTRESSARNLSNVYNLSGVLRRAIVGLGFVLGLGFYPSFTGQALYAGTYRETALHDYVRKPDPAYSWKLEKTFKGAGYQVFVLQLTSQTWRSASEVSEPLWTHGLTVVRPDVVKSEKALLIVGNGKRSDPLPEQANPQWVDLAKKTSSVVIELTQIPNQPLMFFQDGEERSEDNVVAFSWKQVMKTKDPTWSIRLPMVKSIVRAMDATQEFLLTSEGGKIQVKDFVLSGASKRGWAVWLAAAVDVRVSGIIPLVIDVLNVQKCLKHHYSSYGFWAPAVKDYVNHGILDQYDSPEFFELMQLEDPYFYRDQITVPKYIITASGDQFFLPDSSQFYFHELKGPNFLRVIPNAEHSMKGTDVFQSVGVFYRALVEGIAFPEMTWKKKKDGSLFVHLKAASNTEGLPENVKVCTAQNLRARDFRESEIGKAYICEVLPIVETGKYHVYRAPLETGFKAFFVEYEFTVNSAEDAAPLKLTTEVSVLPDVYPFK